MNGVQARELSGAKGHNYSVENGFTHVQHNYAATRIRDLFKLAKLLGEYNDKNGKPEILSIKRFACPVVITPRKCIALITVKETREHKVYALELTTQEKLGDKLKRFEQFKRTSTPSSEEILAKVNSSVKTYFDDVSKREATNKRWGPVS